MHGCVRAFVGPVHDRVANDLLQGSDRIGRGKRFHRTGQEIHGRAVAGAAWPHANPGTPPVTHRRRIRRLDGDNRDGVPAKHMPADRQGRRRHDVAIGLDVGKLAQQLVRNRQTDGIAVVVRAHERHAGAAMVGKVIGEGADGFADSTGTVCLPATIPRVRPDRIPGPPSGLRARGPNTWRSPRLSRPHEAPPATRDFNK